MEENGIMNLPVDINHRILTHIPDPASLVCAASSCKLWRDIIMGSTYLNGLKMQHLDRDFTSSILLGFFYQGNIDSSLHKQLYTAKFHSLDPSFIPTSELLTGKKKGQNALTLLSLSTFIPGFAGSLNFYEPVTSQDKFLVVYHRSQDADGCYRPDAIRVCNPLTGDVFLVPDLQHILPPDCYALLVNDDVSLDGHISQSFVLVAVWKTGKKFFYCCYCSKTKAWRKPTKSSELTPGLFVSSSTVASHGRIHWLCGSLKNRMLTHVVTLHVDREELSYLELPFKTRGDSLLAISADGTVLLLLLRDFCMSLWKNKSETGCDTSKWVLSETINLTSYLPRQPSIANVRLEIFQGKSGAVVLWIEDEGLLLFSLGDRSVIKLDNERLPKKYCFCPYEIDWLSGLAATNHIIDGSMPLDVGWKKIQRRWRTLMPKGTV